MKYDIQSFASTYAAANGKRGVDTFALADALAAEFGEMSREDFCRLVNQCEDAINALTGYVSPFADLTEAPNAWSPV
jgi:hypothetical protein